MNLSDLQAKLKCKDCSLIGCARRNRWSPQPIDWRYLRGNAVLECAGRKERVTGGRDVGSFDVYLAYGWRERTETVALVFRGGRWKSWWEADFQLLAALIVRYNFPITGVVVLRELDSELTEHYVAAPPSELAGAGIRKAIERWETSQRIPKNSDRAKASCLYCPVKARCDALDMERNETDDWPQGYRVG